MPLLTLTDVSKRFGEITAVDGVSFSVNRGEVVGFLGPNGAGKTTTMRLITQFLEPDRGQVSLDDEPVSVLGRAAKQRIGYLPENNPLYGDMLVVDYLGFIADLRRLAGPERVRAFGEAVASTGIASVFYRPIGELSKGFRQRVGLAQAILHRPDLLVLDEPTEGLDPNQRIEIRRLITELGKDRTVLLSTHVLSEVENTCGRLLIIHGGRLVADGPVEDLARRAQGAAQVHVEVAGESVLEALRGLPGVTAVVPTPATGDGRVAAILTVEGDSDVRPEVFRLAQARAWTLYELHQSAASLETLFRQLTGGGRV